MGKLVVDGLVASYDSKMVARVLHPDMPPHATLDSEGLLRPPHLSIHSVNIGSQTVLCICSDAQPTTAAGQYEVAESILDFIKEHSDSRLYVLAGLAMDPEAQGIHIVCSEEGTMESMEEHGIEVRTGQPESGMIGLAGLLVSSPHTKWKRLALLRTLSVAPQMPEQRSAYPCSSKINSD